MYQTSQESPASISGRGSKCLQKIERMIDMAKLRPRDIFFNDPYFDYATCSKPGDLRLAKRVEVFGKWYKTPNLVTTLLSQERLTFSRYTGTDKYSSVVLMNVKLVIPFIGKKDFHTLYL